MTRETRTVRIWGGSALPLTRVSGMAPPVEYLDSLGAPTSRLLQRAGMPSALLEEGEALVPLHLVQRFVEVAADWTYAEDLGAALRRQSSVRAGRVRPVPGARRDGL